MVDFVERHQDQVIIGKPEPCHKPNSPLVVQLPNEVVYPPVPENIPNESPTVVSTHTGDAIPTSVADVQPTSSASLLGKLIPL